MAGGSALVQQRGVVCGAGGVAEGRGWRGERGVCGEVRLGLSSSWQGRRLQCGRRRAMEVVVRGSGTRAVTEEMQAECSAAEVQNGAYVLPAAVPSVSGNSPANEHIGYGEVFESNFYRERFVVRFSEVGDRKTMSLEGLASLMQEAACNHVLKVGYGAFAGTNGRVVTVTTRMHIEVDRYPVWRDLLEVDTWYCTEGRNAVRRDWTVKDVETGEIIAMATSTWVLMNMDTKAMVRINDQIRSEFAPWARDPPKWALSEDRIKASSGRIPKINGDAEFSKTGLSPTERDLDMNQHVNNVKYISWTMESLPFEFRESHEIRKITLEYRREAQKGDSVESRAKAEPLIADGATFAGYTEEPSEERFVHVIRNQDGQEINKGRTVWARLRK
ncbi:hypothetical protein M758_2G084700 [Ceratodon purpureus]|nr:hypothetical protein M758_2G084700 [Ceratodon purpureus]